MLLKEGSEAWGPIVYCGLGWGLGHRASTGQGSVSNDHPGFTIEFLQFSEISWASVGAENVECWVTIQFDEMCHYNHDEPVLVALGDSGISVHGSANANGWKFNKNIYSLSIGQNSIYLKAETEMISNASNFF